MEDRSVIFQIKNELKEELKEVKEDVGEIKKDLKVLVEMRYRFLGGVKVLTVLISIVGFMVGVMIAIMKK